MMFNNIQKCIKYKKGEEQLPIPTGDQHIELTAPSSYFLLCNKLFLTLQNVIKIKVTSILERVLSFTLWRTSGIWSEDGDLFSRPIPLT